MRDYYIIKFTWKGASHFIIWYTDDEDGVILDNDDLALFNDIDECRRFAHRSGIRISEESANRYDFDRISSWVSSPQSDLIEPKHFIDAWNLIDDITSSLHIKVGQDVIEDEERNLYDKLFWANNLPAVTPANSEYKPVWTNEEIDALARSLSRGLRIIESITSN